MMKVDTHELAIVSDKQQWDHYFQRLPLHLQDINYTFDYFNLYHLNGSGDPRLFVYTGGDRCFFYPFLLRSIETEVLENEWFDIESAYGYSGPISTSQDQGFLQSSTMAFRDYCRQNKIVTEFIRFHPLIKNQELAIQGDSMSVIPLRDYVYVDLEKSEEEIWNSFTSQNRNKIRKAEKNGVEVIYDKDCSYFDDFVRIYYKNMEHLNASGLYFFSEPFFASLKKLIAGNGLLLLAKKKDEVLGASAFLLGNMYGHYFLSSATAEGKKLAVSNLLLSKGINHCKRAGMKMLHLGGGMTDSPDDSLLVFKKNFSALTAKFCIGKRIHFKQQYDLVCADWDQRFAPESGKYKNILQRYRWNKEDLL